VLTWFRHTGQSFNRASKTKLNRYSFHLTKFLKKGLISLLSENNRLPKKSA